MSPKSQALSAYGTAAVRTMRGSEYAIFAKVTHALRAVDEADATSYPRMARAVTDNQRLWGALAEDLLSEENQLPLQLRANLISLAEFVRKHSMAVLGGRGSLEVLIDINTAIMKGLRGEIEAAA